MKRQLTDKEAAALRLLADGYSAKEAAQKVGISPSTMKDRIAIIRHKLGVNTTAHAVSAAHQDGVLK